ncbi:hypothetical protein FNV43_RR11128 [Rhamnella rubrinervis]|uniref:RING-type E3 ubiquitin transferase n=1 Tax=Rhamnella rubrinervis TaxID=2594499 RepID=A0A8K0H4Z9_9ROSA|nr:hypothetical protein FNV43_RR11128 [Rhamnella rubrinervis]
MAMKHRKLFPADNGTNQTDCSEFCDPPCSYNCYPFTEFYYPSPPPPPPLTPLSAIDHKDQTHTLSPYVIILLSLVASFLLLISYYVVVVKSCGGFRGGRNNEPAPSQSDTVDEESFLDENRVDHPIWFITTVGLRQSIINSITVCKYKKGEGLIEGTECSVCLNEFQEDETLRLLPKCNHAFHIPCIDTWLRSHTNCPLCRAIIVTDSLRPPLPSLDPNGEATAINEEIQMENSDQTDIQMGENRIRSPAEELEGDQTLQVVDDERSSKESINSHGNCVSEVEVQSVRRSVSMDSIIFSPECEENSITQLQSVDSSHMEVDRNKEEEVGYSSVRRPSVAPCLRLSPVSMKRSFSYGGRFFPPKHNRSLNSVLPL